MTAATDDAPVRVFERDDCVEVWLNRPAARNSINQQVIDAVTGVLDRLEAAPKFLIITGGTEGIFAAGADLHELRARTAADALHGPNARLYERLVRTPLPTIAAIDGYALGGGAELALACDFRVATRRSVFGQPEGRLGLLAAAGGAWRLPQLVGLSVARQMLLLGRRLSGEEAHSAGLVDALADEPAGLLPAAHGMVDEMREMSHFSLRLAKVALAMPAAAHPEFDLVAQGLLYEEGARDRLIDDFFERGAQRGTPRDARSPE